ncbi:uncharacterized protein ACLA_092070 [Aspergillus clavatus NRRL 1]|uniref:Uncharacterized protein n=1 Tax=Aspergillus clavatus (strain ATCC 1007 / CBS 513.65 / DSM 816 / NCTC 3887 / NRRL 1 / QM 1276 / 107) TaxID=344612 RepID=A1CF60_ASPCL|nr:uncharacterized protein ACLA_092070 [Aspergillus clavatus NRRL 1]EAW11509.1 conserved hypothetical protein [Aspergillus clavatus NRRL 1]
MAKGIHGLAEVISFVCTAPRHKDSVHVRSTGFSSPADRVDFPNVTDTWKPTISVVIPLWEEAGVLRIYVDSRPVDRDAEASESPESSLLVRLAFEWGLLAFIVLLGKGFVSLVAFALGELGKLGRFLEGTPKVGLYLAADSAPSLYEEVDALVEGNVLSQAVASGAADRSLTLFGTLTPLEVQQVLNIVYILPQVEQAISRLERQRLVTVFSNLGFRTVQEPIVNPNGIVDGLMDTAQGTPDVLDSSAPHLPRKWALVVRRPENLSPLMVFQLVCALLAGWERHTASAVPDAAGLQVAEEPENDADGAPTSGSRRRKRPSQAKRKRYARRLKEREEGLNGAAEALAEAAPSPSARPTTREPPAPTRSQGPRSGGNRVSSQDARHGQYGGPHPAPAPVMGAYPSPYGWQPMYRHPTPHYYPGQY